MHKLRLQKENSMVDGKHPTTCQFIQNLQNELSLMMETERVEKP